MATFPAYSDGERWPPSFPERHCACAAPRRDTIATKLQLLEEASSTKKGTHQRRIFIIISYCTALSELHSMDISRGPFPFPSGGRLTSSGVLRFHSWRPTIPVPLPFSALASLPVPANVSAWRNASPLRPPLPRNFRAGIGPRVEAPIRVRYFFSPLSLSLSLFSPSK